MRTLTLKSFAKLNLFLKVLNKRPDNYHNIETLFERISLYDTISLRLRSDRIINITCENPDLPTDETNFCYKSAKVLQDKYKVKKGVDIKIMKRIPISAGLGGGSSNAATTLIGLNRLWRLNLSLNRLVTLSKLIGCDVPFFIYNSPFAKGLNRGDKIVPINALKELRLWHILVVPKITVSTPLVYKKWDAFSGLTPAPTYNKKGKKLVRGLTTSPYNVKMITSALRIKAVSLLPAFLYNGLEDVTLRLYPQVMRVKKELIHLGLKSILMSGSGPAVFGVVSSRKEAVRVCNEARKPDRSWRIFIVSTV